MEDGWRLRVREKGKKRKRMPLVWPSPSSPWQQEDHPVTGEKDQRYKDLKMCSAS